MKKTFLKISYLILSAFILLASSKAYAHEVVNAKEIENPSFVDSSANEDYEFMNNSLGEDFYKTTIPADKPEYKIDNLHDFLAKRRQKASVEEVVDNTKKDDININCDEMEYFDEREELEVRGHVEIITQSGTKAYADKGIYNKTENTIRLYDNVVLQKDTATVEGDYMLIDLNEENALMDEPTTKMGNLIINAKEGHADSDNIENLNGNVELKRKVEMEFYSRGFSAYNNSINERRMVDFETKNERSKPYSFKTKEIIIVPEKDHNVLTMKDVDIYYKNKKILRVPSFDYFTNKEMTTSEMDFPLEVGSVKSFGLYAGVGHTFKLPKDFTFRLAPAFVYGEDEVGVGALARLHSKRINLEGGWATSTNNAIVDGQFKITDKINFDIGRHVYKNDWFLGSNRAGYIAELSYDDSFLVRDLGEETVFRHRITAGYVADYKRHHQEDDMRDGMRYRYQAELSKNIKTFGSKEQDMFINFSAVAQGMASVYSETGDTAALFRMGPRIESRLKRWNSRIEYTFGGIHGLSPYMFDEYRYGRQSVTFDESIILCKYLSLGYRGTLTPLKDNREEDLITENRIYAIVGPEDIKLAFSYDTIRQNMHLDFLFLLGSDNLNMKYDKLTVKNYNKFNQKEDWRARRALYKIKVPEDL